MTNADREKELLALGKEIEDRRQVIVDEWKKNTRNASAWNC